MEFSNNKNLERILQQNSVNFCENFHKIHQTAKISAQQCCHAARVFVTLLSGPEVSQTYPRASLEHLEGFFKANPRPHAESLPEENPKEASDLKRG